MTLYVTLLGQIRGSTLEGGKMGNSTGKAPSSLKQDRKKKANGKVDSANDG
jgi:hypothetical protein